MGKKNLDKLFQEKFSDFSDTPDEKVWQSIEASLDRKKKSRKIIPLWWTLGGIAAVLVFALYLINPFEDSAVKTPIITDIEAPENRTNPKIEESQQREVLEKSDIDIVNVENQDSLLDNTTKEEYTSNTFDEERKIQRKKTNVIDPNSPAFKNEGQIVNEDATYQKNNSKNSVPANPTFETNTIIKDKENAVVTTDKTKSQNSVEENIISRTKEKLDLQNKTSVKKESGIAQVEENNTGAEESEEVKKKSLFDEIAEQEQEKETIAESKGGKWSAGPSVAPVYFDAIGEGSPVHSIFVPNSKSGDLNLSYGLFVAYEINDKLKIRSGVHRVDYGYSTDDVEFSSSLESAAIGQIANVNYSATAKNIVVGSNATESGVDAMENAVPIAQDFSGQGLSQNGAMTQQFGYLEVPVELEYALVDKKFGVNLIGGISSLFLVDNSISLSSGELITEMGEANNVNEVNFSTNVGIGLNYQFTPKVQLNVEPVFKYQLNTFSQTDGTFQPFTIGVYSGISFKF